MHNDLLEMCVEKLNVRKEQHWKQITKHWRLITKPNIVLFRSFASGKIKKQTV